MLCCAEMILHRRHVIWVIGSLLSWATGGTSPAIAQQAEGSQPKHEVRLERSVLVHMRDDVRLSTDLYFPIGAPEPLPTVVIRTPYGKNGYREGQPVPIELAKRGYVDSP